MKYKLTSLFATVLLASSLQSNAALVTVSTGFSLAFADTDDVAIPAGTGIIVSGFFSTIDDVDLISTAPSSLSAAFNPFTSATQSFGSDGGSGFEGFVNYTSNALRVGAASPFLNQNVYVFFGNAATIEDSTQFAVFKSTLTWPDDSGAATDADLTIDFAAAAPGTWLVGTTGGTTNILATDIPSVQMAAAIPEPSVALLGAFGVLGLLRRRR